MNNVLVTGANGLLGSALVRVLEPDHEVTKLTREWCDLTDPKQVDKFFKMAVNEIGVNTVIHAAAKVGGVLKNTEHNEEMFMDNVMINNNVFNACHKYGIMNMVNVLSTCIFPADATYPLTPDQMYDGDPHFSSHGYALSKRLSAMTVICHKRVMKDNWINVIPTNIYGPGDNFNLETSHVLAGLISKAHTASQTGEDFVVWGDGTPLRQFIYVDDLAQLIRWAMINHFWPKPLMAVNPQEYSIREVAELIACKFNIPNDRIKFDASKPSGRHQMTASTDFPDREFTSLSKGIDITIDWYLNNLNNIRK